MFYSITGLALQILGNNTLIRQNTEYQNIIFPVCINCLYKEKYGHKPSEMNVVLSGKIQTYVAYECCVD